MICLPLPPQQPAQVPAIISYQTLRKVVGFLGLFLAPILVLGDFALDSTWKIQISLSAYYYTGVRDEMVGIICCISIFLLSYDGYTEQDSIISKLAGLFALGIVLFPTSPTSTKADIVSKLHYITAGIFFALLSYMSIFLFTRNSGNPTPQKIKRDRLYRVCGIVMALSFIGIPIDSIPSIHNSISFLKPTLIFETLALTAFGISWLTKGQVFYKD